MFLFVDHVILFANSMISLLERIFIFHAANLNESQIWTWLNPILLLGVKINAKICVKCMRENIKIVFSSLIGNVIYLSFSRFSRRLHCPRNLIHIHLFVSFILRATISFVIENALVHGVGFPSDVKVTDDNTMEFLDNGSVSTIYYINALVRDTLLIFLSNLNWTAIHKFEMSICQ